MERVVDSTMDFERVESECVPNCEENHILYENVVGSSTTTTTATTRIVQYLSLKSLIKNVDSSDPDISSQSNSSSFIQQTEQGGEPTSSSTIQVINTDPGTLGTEQIIELSPEAEVPSQSSSDIKEGGEENTGVTQIVSFDYQINGGGREEEETGSSGGLSVDVVDMAEEKYIGRIGRMFPIIVREVEVHLVPDKRQICLENLDRDEKLKSTPVINHNNDESVENDFTTIPSTTTTTTTTTRVEEEGKENQDPLLIPPLPLQEIGESGVLLEQQQNTNNNMLMVGGQEQQAIYSDFVEIQSLKSPTQGPLQVPLRQKKTVPWLNKSEEETITSVNGVTTIEIKPTHPVINTSTIIHTVNIPLKRAIEIRRNRTMYKKSSRLSQFMSSEFKLDAPTNPLSVNKLGASLKKKWHLIKRINKSDSEDDKSQMSPCTDFHDENIQGQNEFEELRRLVKQGGDFCKDLSAVLQERSDLEAQYSKGLAKLSAKLLKASKEATGSVAHAWQAVAVQIDTQAELHRLWSVALQEEVARPLKTSTDTQHKIRKSVEVLVDKTTRNLAEWRTAEAKAKRQCFSNSKEFEKLQDSNSDSREVRSRLLSVPIQSSDPIKLESKKRKAEEAVRRADIEYYTFCVRSERARLEWEGSIRNGSTCLRTLEEEKLILLKDLASKYFLAMNELMPKLMRSTEVLEEPIKVCNVDQDMQNIGMKRLAEPEQLLPDFYAEDTSNLMKKERRSEALLKFLFLLKQDLDRERKGAVGVENLAKAIAEAPKIDNSHHDISDKLYYMKSMLLYLEASRLKLDMAICDIEGRPKPSSSILQYMRHQRDKQGLPQTILKVPTWARDECLTPSNDSPDWNSVVVDRNHVEVNHPDTDPDFDEFSSEAGSSDNVYDVNDEEKDRVPSIGKCRVIYDYDANMFDELTIRAGDLINIHDKQEDGWWLGEIKGTVGIFPATYVEEISPPYSGGE